MSEQETIDNDALAAQFQGLLMHELQARGVHFTKATAVNMGDVNIDVHIYIEDYWGLYLFKYIGIYWLKERKLAEMTLAQYVKGYVGRELAELKSSVEWEIKHDPEMIARDNLTQSYRDSIARRLDAARKIAIWLIKDAS